VQHPSQHPINEDVDRNISRFGTPPDLGGNVLNLVLGQRKPRTTYANSLRRPGSQGNWVIPIPFAMLEKRLAPSQAWDNPFAETVTMKIRGWST
jgi:hypothetical protein